MISLRITPLLCNIKYLWITSIAYSKHFSKLFRHLKRFIENYVKNDFISLIL
jgi:hypothetical protein